ncbi:MAG TPA: hypothetical protein VIP46_05050, partial [Pyrinomonadaceae bacterium]
MRRERKRLPLLLALALLLCGPAASGQQPGEQLDAEVARVRQEIQELERASVPAGRAARHRGIVEDKRIRLHGLLQQQRDQLSAYRDLLVRNRAADTDVREVEGEIQAKASEMEEVKGALRASMSGAASPARPQPGQTPAQPQ